MTDPANFCQEVLRITILLTFSWSAAAKVFSMASFRSSISSLALPSPLGARATAACVIAAEVCIVALVILWGESWLPYAAASIFLIIATALLARAMISGVDATCACFGGTPVPVTFRQVLRDAILLGAAITGLILAATTRGDNVSLGLWLPATASAIVLTAPLAFLDDIIEIIGPSRKAI